MPHSSPTPFATSQTKYKVEYETKTALFGLLSYEVRISSQKIQDELHIITDIEPEHVFINGKAVIIK